jgi:hypothetical protein
VSRSIEEFFCAKGAAAMRKPVAADEKQGAERFHPANCAGWGGGLSAQADAFAGANAEEKIGLLRSK